jgi:hypothetical protein
LKKPSIGIDEHGLFAKRSFVHGKLLKPPIKRQASWKRNWRAPSSKKPASSDCLRGAEEAHLAQLGCSLNEEMVELSLALVDTSLTEWIEEL